MNGIGRVSRGAIVLAGFTLWFSGVAAAQAGAAGGAAAGAAANSSINKNIGKDKSPTNLENSLELVKPADLKEETAYKNFQAVSPENPKKKIELGEAFLERYPASQYKPPVYSALTAAYLQTNQVQKMEQAGEKAIALNPKDVQVLAMLGQTLPRAITANTPDQAKELDKAEQYSKRAIEGTPALQKPEGMPDAQFAQAKNQTLAIAHSGLGLVYFRRGNYAEAIVELDQSVKLDPRSDPVNYYVLGVANHNMSHFGEAAAAFSKCAEFQGSMQATCKDSAEKDKAKAAAQTSAPK
jgi:tetratricopeptide (TPR) repeat protein